MLTTLAIAGIALFWALKVHSNTIFFLQLYVRFIPDPMGSDAKNTLTSKKLGKNVTTLLTFALKVVGEPP